MIKYVITTFICIVIMSCNFFDKNTQKYRKIALEWHNRQIILPTRLPDKGICCDTLYPVLTTKKYKIFTYLSLILSGLPVMYCSFTLISYQWENQFLLAIIINLLILVIVFCLTGKKYMKYKILFIVLGGVLGFFYFV